MLYFFAVINSCHISLNIDRVVSAILGVFTAVTGFSPRYKTQGGTDAEGLSLQNIQSRLRWVSVPQDVLLERYYCRRTLTYNLVEEWF